MAGNEKQMWTALRPHMVNCGLDPIRVENPALPGTPDVNYIHGWIELKNADRWPPKGGPLQLPHPPTAEQRTFLLRREMSGGRAFLCLRVKRDWYLLHGRTTAALWAHDRLPPTKEEIETSCLLAATSPKQIAEKLRDLK